MVGNFKSRVFFSAGEKETEDAAFELAEKNMIKFGDIIALRGDLGAGKTAFTRGMTKFFSPRSRVSSPTFSLVNEYAVNAETSRKILHFDMYRINSEDDLLSVGFYDYLDGMSEKVIVIEWFEKISDIFDENTVTVDIVKMGGDERKIIYERLKD